MRRWCGVGVLAVSSACGAGNAGSKPAPPLVDVASFSGTAHPMPTAAGGPSVSLPDMMLGAVSKYDAAITKRPEVTPHPVSAADVAALYAPNATLRMPGPVEAQGRDAIAAAWTQMWSPISPRDFAASRVIVKGNVLVVQWDFRGGLNDADGASSWYGVPATKGPIPVGFAGLTIWTFNADGLISDDRTYFDIVAIYAQLGAGPPGVEAGDLTTVNTDDAQRIDVKGTPDEQKNAQIPQALAQAINARSEPDFLAPFSEKVVREGPNGLAVGIDGEKGSYERLVKTFPDLKETADNVFAAGEFVVSEVTDSGTQLGAMGSFAPSKKQATWHGAELYQVKDGKIVHDWIYTNRLELLSQLGAWKRP